MFREKEENQKIVIMDFSGVYKCQQFWRTKNVSWVDVRDVSGTNCYCDKEAMEELRRRIEEFPAAGIHFLDSGNYHYMSRIWLEKIQAPFRLLVFDNHTDMQPPAFGGLLSCGGWISDALEELGDLQEVILVGPDREAFLAVEGKLKSQVQLLAREELREMEVCHMEGFFRELSVDLPLYISIDKDILCPKDASTTWSQGDMSLGELISCLHTVLSAVKKGGGRILGADICGECEPGETGSVNDRANDSLLKLLQKGTDL